MQPQPDSVIRQLNSFLRGEISAVETYQTAFDKIRHFPEKHDLVDCQRSHQERAALLRTRILAMGGDPVESSGVWGTVAKLVENGAALLSDHMAIAALEEGEDRGLRDYRDGLDKLEGEARELVEIHLLPEQQRTHDVIHALREHHKRVA
jgi:uncharacterized protein (TIGR02284 family)